MTFSFPTPPTRPPHDKQVIFSLQHLNNSETGFPRAGGTSLGLQQKAAEQGLESHCFYPGHFHRTPYGQQMIKEQTRGGVTNQSRVYIVGHGIPGDDKIVGQDAQKNKNPWTVQELADLIASQYTQIPGSTEKLDVSLIACYGGMSGLYGEPSIAERLCQALYERGIDANVTGRMGPVMRHGGGEYRKYVDMLEGQGYEHGRPGLRQTFSMDPLTQQITGTIGKGPQPLQAHTPAQSEALCKFMDTQCPFPAEMGGWITNDERYEHRIASPPLDYATAETLLNTLRAGEMSMDESCFSLSTSPRDPNIVRIMVDKSRLEQEMFSQITFYQHKVNELSDGISTIDQYIKDSQHRLHELQTQLTGTTSADPQILSEMAQLRQYIQHSQQEAIAYHDELQFHYGLLTAKRAVFIPFVKQYEDNHQFKHRAQQTMKLQQDQALLATQLMERSNQAVERISAVSAEPSAIEAFHLAARQQPLPPPEPDTAAIVALQKLNFEDRTSPKFSANNKWEYAFENGKMRFLTPRLNEQQQATLLAMCPSGLDTKVQPSQTEAGLSRLSFDTETLQQNPLILDYLNNQVEFLLKLPAAPAIEPVVMQPSSPSPTQERPDPPTHPTPQPTPTIIPPTRWDAVPDQAIIPPTQAVHAEPPARSDPKPFSALSDGVVLLNQLGQDNHFRQAYDKKRTVSLSQLGGNPGSWMFNIAKKAKDESIGRFREGPRDKQIAELQAALSEINNKTHLKPDEKAQAMWEKLNGLVEKIDQESNLMKSSLKDICLEKMQQLEKHFDVGPKQSTEFHQRKI